MSFIPYQVDYAVKNAAKTLGFSKKRVSFKFGFADQKALSEGLTGPACRGSEHELVFVWSLKTGKRQLLLDGKDVHFSETGQNGWTADRAWQHAFSLNDRVGGSYRVHFTSQPTSREDPNSRPFDLRIGNMSYFEFNPIYTLGTPRMITGQKSRNGGSSRNHYGRDSPMSPEERHQLAQARLESLRDLREQEERQAERVLAAVKAKGSSAPLKREEDSLISFDDDPAPPPPPRPPVPVASSGLPPPAAVPGGLGHPVTSTGSAAPPPPVPGSVPLNNNYYTSSSITLDAAIEENQPPLRRQQPGSMYGSNPYAQPPTAAPYGSNNPYAAAPAPMTYGAPAPPQPSSSSNALTPYNPAAAGGGPQQQQQPYVDATGRLSMGQQQQPQQPQTFGVAYGMGSNSSLNFGASAGSLNYSGSTTTTNNPSTTGSLNYSSSNNTPFAAATVSSPSNQTSYSQMSFGSAPSFAQPPSQPPQAAPQYSSGYPPQQPPPQQQQPQSYPPPPQQSYNY